MNIRKRSIEGLKWSSFETIGVRLFSVSTYFILARLLDPAAFGLVALTNTFIFFSEIFVEQGFVAALVQKKNLEPSHLSSAFWGNLVLGVLLFCVTYLLAPWISSLYNEPLLVDILRVHAITYIISSFAKVHLALLQKDLLLKQIAIARTTAIVVSCVVSIVMAYLGYGAWSLVFQQIVFNFLQTVMLWILDKWKPTVEFSWVHFQEIFSFGSKVMLNQSTSYFIRYTDTLLVGYFLGTNALGYYSFAQKIYITLTDVVNLTFNKVIFSVFSMLQDQREQLVREFYKFADLMATIAFPLFTMAFIFTPHAVPLLFSEKWALSAPIIQVFSIAGLLVCFYACFNNLFPSIGRVGLNARIKILYLVVSVLLILGAVQFSAELVAATHIIAMLITLIIMGYFTKKFIGLSIKRYLVGVFKPLPVSLLIAILVYTSSKLVGEVTLFILIAQGLVSLAIYAGYILLARPNLLEKLKRQTKKRVNAQ